MYKYIKIIIYIFIMEFLYKKECKKINYDALDKLEKGIGFIFNDFESVNICGYKLIQNEINTFPMYLMLYNSELSEYSFPIVSYKYSIKNILIYISHYLYNLIVNNMNIDEYGNKKIIDIENFKRNITVNGYRIFNDKIYLFIDLTNIKIITNHTYNKFTLDWGLFTDFTNRKKIYDKNINFEDCLFVTNNADLFLIRDKNNNIYEPPNSAYIETEKEYANYLFNFGPIKLSKEIFLGSCYYFKNYDQKIKTNALVRFAIFYGKYYVKQNFPNDTVDESQIKKDKLELYDKLENSFINNNYELEKQTMRISDYDGNWKENFDSVIVSELELDNGKNFIGHPTIAIKSNEQFFSLSYVI